MGKPPSLINSRTRECKTSKLITPQNGLKVLENAHKLACIQLQNSSAFNWSGDSATKLIWSQGCLCSYTPLSQLFFLPKQIVYCCLANKFCSWRREADMQLGPHNTHFCRNINFEPLFHGHIQKVIGEENFFLLLGRDHRIMLPKNKVDWNCQAVLFFSKVVTKLAIHKKDLVKFDHEWYHSTWILFCIIGTCMYCMI